MSFSLDQRLVALEKVITAAASTSNTPEITSYLCRLGSILVCGHLERSLELILCERFSGTMPPQMSAFLKKYFDSGINYQCEKIIALLNRFDSNWGAELQDFILTRQQLKESVSSCYAIRNSVSHGGGQNLGISALRQYFGDIFTLIAEIEHIVNKKYQS